MFNSGHLLRFSVPQLRQLWCDRQELVEQLRKEREARGRDKRYTAAIVTVQAQVRGWRCRRLTCAEFHHKWLAAWGKFAANPASSVSADVLAGEQEPDAHRSIPTAAATARRGQCVSSLDSPAPTCLPPCIQPNITKATYPQASSGCLTLRRRGPATNPVSVQACFTGGPRHQAPAPEPEPPDLQQQPQPCLGPAAFQKAGGCSGSAQRGAGHHAAQPGLAAG